MYKAVKKVATITFATPAVPKSWRQVAGLMKNKKEALAAYTKQIRKEWHTK